VLAFGVPVVDEQPNAHAAPGGSGQFAHELQADAVVLQLVILDVERALGAADQGDPGIEREVAGRQQPKARPARPGSVSLVSVSAVLASRGGIGGRLAQSPRPAATTRANSRKRKAHNAKDMSKRRRVDPAGSALSRRAADPSLPPSIRCGAGRP